MSLAYQQQQSRHRQQQVVHHEPSRQELPARSATEQPDFEERFGVSGNSERAALVGLEGGGGQGVASPPAPGSGMDAFRAVVHAEAAADTLTIGPRDLGIEFQLTEDGLVATADACVDRMARFEDASNRWYHLGRGREQYEQEKPQYELDIRMYQRLALRVRQDGARIEGIMRLADQALRESDATRLLLEDRGLAASTDGAGFALDDGLVGEDLAQAREAFASTGYRPTQESMEAELRQGGADLLDALAVQGHGLGFVISGMRAQAQARRSDAVAGEVQRIDAIIATCDRFGELLRLMTAALSLGGTLTAREGLGEVGSKATDVLDPFELPGAAARLVYEDELHALAGRLAALGAAEDGWRELGHHEQIRQALGEYCAVVHSLDEHGAASQALRDDYVGGLGNLGRIMDVDAIARGLPGARERGTGRAMENLARIRATHLALEGVTSPLEEAMLRTQESQAVFGEFSRERVGQAWLNQLRGDQGGLALFYKSVHAGLAATLEQVTGRSEELAGSSESFGALLSRVAV